MSERAQRVFVANGEVLAQQVRGFLEAGGIAATVRGESLRHTHGLTLDGLGMVEVFVSNTDVAQAHALLDSAEAGQFRVADDFEESVNSERSENPNE